MFTAIVIDVLSHQFPSALKIDLAGLACSRITVIGDSRILQNALLGFVCSTRCPGDVILQTYDLARALRDAEIPVIGGFHSPMEKECLDLLLRGRQPVVVCPAREIDRMRIPTAWRPALEEGRLLIASPFSAPQSRPTADIAIQRTRFVAVLATEIFVVHAEPGGKTDDLCRWCLDRKLSVSTLSRTRRPSEQLEGIEAVTIPELIRKVTRQNRCNTSSE